MNAPIDEILRARSIRTALVVDDAYDPVPNAADVSDESSWSNFFDDFNDEDRTDLGAQYEPFKGKSEFELGEDNAFVALLWTARDELRAELVGPLFESYHRSVEHDRQILKTVQELLESFGLQVETAGRRFADSVTTADLIVVDLFLGSRQHQADMETCVRGISKVIEHCAIPPIVVLMSRSSRLQGLSDEFREKTHIFASGFRAIHKSDIQKPGRLEYAVRQLATHRPDHLKLHAFLDRWSTGVTDAVKRTAADIRRLDLEDWATIRDLLLHEEKATAGTYVLDVLELVLLHEVESDLEFLRAAAELDSLEEEYYPPTTIPEAKDTLAIISKTLYEHDNRRELDSGSSCRVEFGDILGPVDGNEPPDDSVFRSEHDGVLVLITMTPACDLMRAGPTRVLFMAGEVKEMRPADSGRASRKLCTPVLDLTSDRRVWVDWQRDNLVTMTQKELEKLLTPDGGGRIVARLRAIHAVALQQQLLGDLGRVGLPAPMPATFPIDVRVLYPSNEEELVPLEFDSGQSIQGVCHVGRSDGAVARAALDAAGRFSFLDALQNLSTDAIHPSSRNKLCKIRDASAWDVLFGRGLNLNLNSDDPQKWSELVDGRNEPLGTILCKASADETLTGNKLKQAGLVFEIQGLHINAPKRYHAE